MHRSHSKRNIALAFVASFVIALAGANEARAQVAVDVNVGAPDADVVVEPPAAYIATAAPEYYDGRPVYYYNDYWYYRIGPGRWGYYRTEPAYLRGRRERWGPGWNGGYGRAGWEHRNYVHGGGGYQRGGYGRGGSERGGYSRGGYSHSAPVRAGGPARYHYRR
ncbi:MAG TPA: hypothetical protein VMJ10_02305 [Kofleriaceae bacterium]|nr:hypothetical protein [Kofleriaceae bacterium]